MFWTRAKSIPLPPREFSEAVGGDYCAIGKQVLDLIRQRCKLRPTDRILDIGSGCGRLAVPLTRYLSGEGAYEGFDVVLPMVEWCRQHISSKFPRFRFQHADLKNTLVHSMSWSPLRYLPICFRRPPRDTLRRLLGCSKKMGGGSFRFFCARRITMTHVRKSRFRIGTASMPSRERIFPRRSLHSTSAGFYRPCVPWIFP
jgi:SAM-dependent methyltransferase